MNIFCLWIIFSFLFSVFFAYIPCRPNANRCRSTITPVYRWINDTRGKLCGAYVLLSTSKAINDMSFTAKLTDRFTFIGHRRACHVRTSARATTPFLLLYLMKYSIQYIRTHSRRVREKYPPRTLLFRQN